jgi:hypothetical protein
VRDAQGKAGLPVLNRELLPDLYENFVQVVGRRKWQLADYTFPIFGRLDLFRRSQGCRGVELADFLGQFAYSR